MPRTIAENPAMGQSSVLRWCPNAGRNALQAVLRGKEESLVRVRIGGERRSCSVSNGVAVVELVEQIVYGDPHCEPVRGLRELHVNDGVRRHEVGEAIGLVIIVVLSADVTRHSAEAGFRRELPGDSRIRLCAWDQRDDVAADVDAADSAVSKARVAQRGVREQRERGGNRGRSIELNASSAGGGQVNIGERRSEEIDLVRKIRQECARAQSQSRGAVFGAQLVVARGLGFEERHDRVEDRSAKLAVDLVHRWRAKAPACAAVDRSAGGEVPSQRDFPGQRGAGLAAACVGGGGESILSSDGSALPARAQSELGSFGERGVVLREEGLITLGGDNVRGRTRRARGSVE